MGEMQQKLPGVKSVEGKAGFCSRQCQVVPWPFGDFLSLSLCGLRCYSCRKRSPTPVISGNGRFWSGGYTEAVRGTDQLDIQEQEPSDSQDLVLELDPGWLLDSAAGVCRHSWSSNQTKPNLCHKETQYMLLPIFLKPPLFMLPHRLAFP